MFFSNGAHVPVHELFTETVECTSVGSFQVNSQISREHYSHSEELFPALDTMTTMSAIQ